MANNCWQEEGNIKHIIDVGSSVNSNTGDFVRVGFIKTQKNFEQLDSSVDRLENCDCLGNTLVTFIPPEDTQLLEKNYTITPNTVILDLEKSTTVRYDVVTSNVSDGQVLIWKNIGNTISSEFTDNVNEGSVTIVSNQGVIDRPVFVGNVNQQKDIILQLRRGSLLSPIVATANAVYLLPSYIRVHLDANNSISYPGSGTTWFDLEPMLQYYNGTINGALYDNYGGVKNFFFDGTNDVVTTNPSPNTTISNNLTIEMWISPLSNHQIDSESTSGNTGLSGQKYIIHPANTNVNSSDLGISVGTNGIGVYEYSNVPSAAIFTTATVVSSPSAPRISGGGAYDSGLLNQAGIWETNINATNFSRTYQVNFPHTGNYLIKGSCDDRGNVYIDGTKVLFIPAFNNIFTNTVNVQAGTRTVMLEGLNTGGPGGLATIIEFAGGAHMPALLSHANTISNINYTHAVVTLQNKQPKLYLNGNLVATGLTSTKSNVYAQIKSVGGGTFGYYKGSLSLLKVYNNALSSTEILRRYNESKNNYNINTSLNELTTQSLVIHLDASNTSSYIGSGDVWNNLVVSNTANVILRNTTTFDPDLGGSFKVNDTGDRDWIESITAPLSGKIGEVNRTSSVTVELWMKQNTAPTSPGLYVTIGDFTLHQDGRLLIWEQTLTNPGGGGGAARVQLVVNPIDSVITQGGWYQIVGTYTSGNRRLYVNGKLVASDSQTGIPQNLSLAPAVDYIRMGGTFFLWWNGAISICRVYTKSLTEDEVLKNYNYSRKRLGI